MTAIQLQSCEVSSQSNPRPCAGRQHIRTYIAYGSYTRRMDTPFLIVVVLGISSGSEYPTSNKSPPALWLTAWRRICICSVIPMCGTVVCCYECQCIQERVPYITSDDSGCAGHQQWIRVSNQQQESTRSPASWLTTVEKNLHAKRTLSKPKTPKCLVLPI
jgi:hypothetical protein